LKNDETKVANGAFIGKILIELSKEYKGVI
jgi:hypothetical protein